MGGVLNFGDMLVYRATVRPASTTSDDDPKGLNRISILAPDRWGPEQIDAIEPWFGGYTEAVPAVGTKVWVFETPDGGMYYAFNAPGGRTTSEPATRWPPMRAILLGILDMLDGLLSHTHSAGTLKDSLGGACTLATGGPVETLSYGDARTDTEGDKPAAHTRLVTHMPQSVEDEE